LFFRASPEGRWAPTDKEGFSSSAFESAAGGEMVAWRLVGGNNRELGRSLGTYRDEPACRVAVTALQRGLDRAEPRMVVTDPTGSWSWMLGLDGHAVAVSGRSYRRHRECQYSLRQFLAALPVAQLGEGPDTKRTPRGIRHTEPEPSVTAAFDGGLLQALFPVAQLPAPAGNHDPRADTTTLSPGDPDHGGADEEDLRVVQGPHGAKANVGPSDRAFRGMIRASGAAVLAVMALVGIFLAYRAAQALHVAKGSFLTTASWEPDSHNFGIAAVLTGTVIIGLVAIVFAVPLATGAALYISEYAPRWMKRTLTSGIDLMAAVPSVVYGLWGFFYLQGHVVGLSRWISTYFSWIPLFKVTGADPRNPLASATVYTSSAFIAGTVVSLMVTPIACSVMREAFSQAPPGEREGAYALGATRWGMIRTVVLPYVRGGVIGGTMLGLGRALGETIAVYMIISPVFVIQPHILQNGTNSVAALIALRYGSASNFGVSALMAAGLALFLMTLVVNFIASSILVRSRSGAGAEA